MKNDFQHYWFTFQWFNFLWCGGSLLSVFSISQFTICRWGSPWDYARISRNHDTEMYVNVTYIWQSTLLYHFTLICFQPFVCASDRANMPTAKVLQRFWVHSRLIISTMKTNYHRISNFWKGTSPPLLVYFGPTNRAFCYYRMPDKSRTGSDFFSLEPCIFQLLFKSECKNKLMPNYNIVYNCNRPWLVEGPFHPLFLNGPVVHIQQTPKYRRVLLCRRLRNGLSHILHPKSLRPWHLLRLPDSFPQKLWSSAG